MTPNPSLDLSNMLTAPVEVELSFVKGRMFRYRKADLMFDAWCSDNYGGVQEYFRVMTSKDDSMGKEVSYAVVRAFYHLITPADQIFLRDMIQLENPLDEMGHEIKLTVVDKLMMATDLEDIKKMVVCILTAKGLSSPNPLTEAEKKKKKKLKNDK